MTQAPTLLLFDLGGVLIENVGWEHFSRMLPEPLETAVLKERWLRSSCVRRFERGECSAADFAAEVVAEFGARVTPERFLVEFTGWPKGFYPEARTLLGALKEKYRLACLSNSNAVHWERFDAFSGVFDVALSSHLLGVIKPDREAFLRALDECAVEAHEVWFFDDALSNVEAAESVGMRAFHVDGFEALKETLVREGII